MGKVVAIPVLPVFIGLPRLVQAGKVGFCNHNRRLHQGNRLKPTTILFVCHDVFGLTQQPGHFRIGPAFPDNPG